MEKCFFGTLLALFAHAWCVIRCGYFIIASRFPRGNLVDYTNASLPVGSLFGVNRRLGTFSLDAVHDRRRVLWPVVRLRKTAQCWRARSSRTGACGELALGGIAPKQKLALAA